MELGEQREAHLGLRQARVDEQHVRPVAFQQLHRGHRVGRDARQVETIRDADETRQALAHTPVRIDHDDAHRGRWTGHPATMASASPMRIGHSAGPWLRHLT